MESNLLLCVDSLWYDGKPTSATFFGKMIAVRGRYYRHTSNWQSPKSVSNTMGNRNCNFRFFHSHFWHNTCSVRACSINRVLEVNHQYGMDKKTYLSYINYVFIRELLQTAGWNNCAIWFGGAGISMECTKSHPSFGGYLPQTLAVAIFTLAKLGWTNCKDNTGAKDLSRLTYCPSVSPSWCAFFQPTRNKQIALDPAQGRLHSLPYFSPKRLPIGNLRLSFEIYLNQEAFIPLTPGR